MGVDTRVHVDTRAHVNTRMHTGTHKEGSPGPGRWRMVDRSHKA